MLQYRLMTARCLQSAGKNNARVVEWVALKVPLTPLPHHSGGVSEGLQRQRGAEPTPRMANRPHLATSNFIHPQDETWHFRGRSCKEILTRYSVEAPLLGRLC